MATPNLPPISALPIPNLYVSDITIPRSPHHLTTHSITHILSLTSTRSLPPLAPEIHHLHIPLEDNPLEDLIGLLDGLCAWIAHALHEERGTVLVHCVQGVSRSAAVVVAYVMYALGVGYEEALGMVRQARGGVDVNWGFGEQVRLWGRMGCQVYEEDGEGVGGLRAKGEYVGWRDARGVLMGREEREEREAVRMRVMELAVRFGGGKMGVEESGEKGEGGES